MGLALMPPPHGHCRAELDARPGSGLFCGVASSWKDGSTGSCLPCSRCQLSDKPRTKDQEETRRSWQSVHTLTAVTAEIIKAQHTCSTVPSPVVEST
jgi:hypothetical protein